MKLVRYVQRQGAPPGAGAPRLGILEGDAVRPTAYGDVMDLLRAGAGAGPGALVALSRGAGAPTPLESLRLLAPLPRPGKIFGSGVNYASHREENPAAVLPLEPGYFAKLPSSVVGPGEPIVLPTPQAQVDYEVELAVVIGRPARRVSRGAALDYVFGYTVVNDVSARSVQFMSPREQWITHGKGFDTFCPMGPALVTAGASRSPGPAPAQLGQPRAPPGRFHGGDALPRGGADRVLEPVHHAGAGGRPGHRDAGRLGTFRDPPLWLQPGDEVAVEVDAVGRLSNPVVAGGREPSLRSGRSGRSGAPPGLTWPPARGWCPGRPGATGASSSLPH